MQHIIFYSWQADLPNSTNRGFIQSALEEAAATITTDLNIEPVIERDTQNVPGSPDIATTIFKKIGNSHAFIADITLINPKNNKRRTPNPNVLLELGYALHALGEERIILVMNRSYGPLEALPFDLKMRRVIPYDMPEDATERAPERHRLASILTTAIKAALASITSPAPTIDETDAASAALEIVAPNRSLLVRRALQEIINDLIALAPPRFHDGGTVEQLLTAIEHTAPSVRRYTHLAEVIASMHDTTAARTLYKQLSTILERYDNHKGFEGRYDERDFDYWKFLGHELLTTLIATLLREERYDTITTLLDENITIPNQRSTRTLDFGEYSEHLRSLDPLKEKHRRLSYHADLLHHRHAPKDRYQEADGPLADILPFTDFLAADYFLFLRGELPPAEARDRGYTWVPRSSVYLNETPRFLQDAQRRATAEQLASALGVTDIPTLKTRLLERAGRLGRMWGMEYDQPLTDDQVERIGTK